MSFELWCNIIPTVTAGSTTSLQDEADPEFGQTTSVLSQISEISYLATQIQTTKQIAIALENLQQGNENALQVRKRCSFVYDCVKRPYSMCSLQILCLTLCVVSRHIPYYNY